MSKKTGTAFTILGLMAFALAFALTAYNLHLDRRAERKSEECAAAITLQIEEVSKDTSLENEASAHYDLNSQMPTEAIEGKAYIGILEIPSKNLRLPVMNEWDYTNLQSAPCHYDGSLYSKDLIIVAHNYESHFGQLKDLMMGDEITFTDAINRVFAYEIIDFETIEPTDLTAMQSGQWDLTLFTCTAGGTKRLAVRCKLVSEYGNTAKKAA